MISFYIAQYGTLETNQGITPHPGLTCSFFPNSICLGNFQQLLPLYTEHNAKRVM